MSGEVIDDLANFSPRYVTLWPWPLTCWPLICLKCCRPNF